MNTIQLTHNKSNKITTTLNVYQSHSNKIGEVKATHISEAFDWNGEKVISLFLETLTDCNYHTEVKEIRIALAKLEQKQKECDLMY
tara:strand:- start:231 stop:488 length:258 start_codon:yes stop_codon:yes gene_type:complete